MVSELIMLPIMLQASIALGYFIVQWSCPPLTLIHLPSTARLLNVSSYYVGPTLW